MTDRLKGVLITFDRDIRTDDAEPLINAIKLLVHVADAKAIVDPKTASYDDHMARARIVSTLGRELIDKIYEVTDPEWAAKRKQAR